MFIDAFTLSGTIIVLIMVVVTLLAASCCKGQD